MTLNLPLKLKALIGLLIIFSCVFAGYFALKNHQKQAQASISSKARFIGYPKMLFPPIDQSVVGWWKLNDNAANTTVKDWSSGGNTGTAQANTNIKSTTGYTAMPNTAMTFNGSTDYVSIPPSVVSSLTVGTVSIWIKPNLSDWGEIMSEGGTEYLEGWHFYYQADGTLNFFVRDSAGNYSPNINTSAGVLLNNTWHHVTVTQNGSVAKLYVDGIEKSVTGTNSGIWFSGQRGTLTARIGNKYFYPPYDKYFNGSISDVRIYNRALSANEVKTLYMKGR